MPLTKSARFLEMFARQAASPSGVVGSFILSNIYLDNFDTFEVIIEKVTTK